MKSKVTRVFVSSLLLAVALSLMGGNASSALAGVQTTQTITLISGDGPIGSQDPANQFTLDGGATWQDAYIIEPNPAYDVIPGTQYINRNPDFSGPEFETTLYRTVFVLPDDFTSPSLTIQIHADNVATIFLNGVEIGQQPFEEIFENFQDPAETFTVTDPSLFQAGENVLEFEIYNFYGPTAFDYKAIVTFSTALEAAIDVKPGSYPNSVNPRSQGVIPVAILTTDTFDATSVDPDTVLFGATGTEAAPVHYAFEDVDGDGDTDLILHFKTSATGISCGATAASLTGETYGGQAIQGSDTIKTAGCK